MDQADLELQLKVWKDLAISKQVLIRAATDALKLDPDCNADALKKALDAAIKRAIDADVTVSAAQEQAKLAMAVMEKKVVENQKTVAAAEAKMAETLAAKLVSEQQMATERETHLAEMKKIKAQLAEKDKAIKAINVTLADTPENVAKKLKTLKKQKFDEAESCKRAETEAASLKKDKKQLEQRVKECEELLENAKNLAEQQRTLHKLCEDLRNQLSSLVKDASTLPTLPVLDEKLLESLSKKEQGNK